MLADNHEHQLLDLVDVPVARSNRQLPTHLSRRKAQSGIGKCPMTTIGRISGTGDRS
jgi:hypothetical protein